MSRRSVAFAAFGLAAGLLSPCGAAAGPRVRPSLDPVSHFPLAPGNRWAYERRGPGDATSTWRVEVVTGGSGLLGRYVTLSGYFLGAPRQVRVDAAQRVSERDYGGRPDDLWYLLGAPPGTTWELRLAELPTLGPVAGCISGSKVRLASRAETVRVPAGTFRNAVRIEVSPPCADAGITSEWFAPGVGLVRREETSIAGPVVSELVQATVSGRVFPDTGYDTSLGFERPLYWNDLMPPVDDDSLPVVRGVFTVANHTDLPLELVFTGCRSLVLAVSGADGVPVLTTSADDGGCCACDSLQRLVLVRGSFSLPFSFRLATADGVPLTDGRYSVSAALQTVDPAPLRPTATAPIQVQTVY